MFGRRSLEAQQYTAAASLGGVPQQAQMQSERETLQKVETRQHSVQDSAVSAGTHLTDFSVAHTLLPRKNDQASVGYPHLRHIQTHEPASSMALNIPQVKGNEDPAEFNELSLQRWPYDPYYQGYNYIARWPHQDQFQQAMSAPYYSSEIPIPTFPTIITNPTIPGAMTSEAGYSLVPHSSSNPHPGESSGHYSGCQSAMALSSQSNPHPGESSGHYSGCQSAMASSSQLNPHPGESSGHYSGCQSAMASSSQSVLYHYQPNLQQHPPPYYYDYYNATPIPQCSNPATPSDPTSPNSPTLPSTSRPFKQKYAGGRKGKGVCKRPADSNQDINLNGLMHALPCSEPLPLNSGASNTAIEPLPFNSGASNAVMEPLPFNSGASNTAITGDTPSTSAGVTERKKRTRTAFTETQLDQMELVFYQNNYPDMYSRSEMSKIIAVNEDRIQVWFQNRRARKKKQIRTGSKSIRFVRREERIQKLMDRLKLQQQAAAVSPAAVTPHVMPNYPHSARGVTICHLPEHQATSGGLGSSGSTIGTE